MSNHELDWLAAQQPQRLAADDAARERALRALVRHSRGPGPRRRPTFGPLTRPRLSAVAALGGAAAIGAALVLTAGGGQPVRSSARPATHAQVTHIAVHGHHAASPLIHLADYVAASSTPSGDATLVQRTTTNANQTVTVYDLYADDGRYFFSRTRAGLPGEVSADHNQANGMFAREVAAAKLAANGDVRTAAQDMADAPNPSHVVSRTEAPPNPAVLAAKAAATGQAVPSDSAQTGTLFDNYAWEDSQDALIAGAGDPQVRAGVLKILATLPGVTVTQGTSDGQPTLVLTAGAPELGDGYTEALTINADTGVPIRSVGGETGKAPAATVDYGVSRVTLANLGTGTVSGN